jgi:hypothetical protein
VYAELTMQAAQSLGLEGFAQFAQDATMKKYARTLSEFFMDDGAKSFASDVCGDRDRAGLISDPRIGYEGIPGGRGNPRNYAGTPFTALGRWDSSGKVVSIAKQVYSKVESAENPQRVFIPAAMVSILSK